MTMAAENFDLARRNMVDCQIRPNQVTDAGVITAFETVPREAFVPSYLQGIAYVDEDVRISENRYMTEPTVLARLLQAAGIKDGDIALDIGCGTGYSAAILSHLATTVIGLDGDADLAEQAEALLQDMDVCNVAVVHGNPRDGYPGQAPFDVILINGSVSNIPPHITDQLAEGGRLVTVLRGAGYNNTGRAVLVTRKKAALETTFLFDAGSYPAPGFDEPEFFTF